MKQDPRGNRALQLKKAKRRCLVILCVVVAILLVVVWPGGWSAKEEARQQYANSPSCDCPAVDSPAQLQACQKESVGPQVKPRGAENLPLGIIHATSDLYPRKLQGNLEKDLKKKPKYLLAISAGVGMKENVDAMVHKFPAKDFSLVIFHYDNKINEWADLKWYDRAIHVAASKQTKWWFAKRFLHPDIVNEYEYLLIWDEDLGLAHFSPYRYLDIVRKYGLEVSQPAIDDSELSRIHWPITRKLNGTEVHWRTDTDYRNHTCSHGRETPPCQGFVEIMAPVFSRAAWRCVWHMIQNDLSHGWGVDFFLGRCAQGDPRRKIGVVDSEWVVHQGVPTLVQQGAGKDAKSARRKVVIRCRQEWKLFKERFKAAVQAEKDGGSLHGGPDELELYVGERTR